MIMTDARRSTFRWRIHVRMWQRNEARIFEKKVEQRVLMLGYGGRSAGTKQRRREDGYNTGDFH